MTGAAAQVLLAGSINLDFIVGVDRLPVPGETVNGSRLVRQGGGKSANQAVAACRVGAEATLLGAVGDDDLGRAALASLSDEGVDTSCCGVIAGEHTGVALIVVDAAGENQIAVAPGANDLVDATMIRQATSGLVARADSVVVVSLEFADDAIHALLDWALRLGLRIVLDPAPARPLTDEMLDAGAILTPNATEAAMLTGSADPADAARRLSHRSGAPVVVTLGSQGALMCANGELTAFAASTVGSVDSTGAGDALNGILAAELARGVELEPALRWAMAGAALSTMQPGARAGMPDRIAIERFLEI